MVEVVMLALVKVAEPEEMVVLPRVVLPVTFKLVEVMLPPIIETALLFWAARLPRPDTEELGIAVPRLRFAILAVPMFAVVRVEVETMN